MSFKFGQKMAKGVFEMGQALSAYNDIFGLEMQTWEDAATELEHRPWHATASLLQGDNFNLWRLK